MRARATPAPPLPAPDGFDDLNRTALLDTWARLIGRSAPKHLSRGLICQVLAYELQAKQRRGLSRATKAALTKTGAAQSNRSCSPGLAPGGRLIRDWNGVTHSVEVTKDGFLWNGKTWRSLSAIAKAITGAHWSGPRFFGLTSTVQKSGGSNG